LKLVPGVRKRQRFTVPEAEPLLETRLADARVLAGVRLSSLTGVRLIQGIRHHLRNSARCAVRIFSAPRIRNFEKTALRPGCDSLLAMKDPTKVESVIVGVFDNAQDLEEADKRLAAEGFEGAVYDEAVGADESCEVTPVAVGPVLAPSVAPTDGSGGPESDLPGIDVFRSHLADCHLSDDVIEAYATAYVHQGRFLVVRTEPECAKHVIAILKDCHAARVNQHDSDALV
jgi:hypothetical protein